VGVTLLVLAVAHGSPLSQDRGQNAGDYSSPGLRADLTLSPALQPVRSDDSPAGRLGWNGRVSP
jgi:hypothetical protein